ncbi:hypothetical protein ACWTWI_04335 [Staphylococcus hominis]
MFFFAIANNTTDEALGIMALMNIDVKNSSDRSWLIHNIQMI